ncbi:MAG: glucose-6-phosphate isomerase [Methanosarcinales archaeon]|nr:glucose-6-phosphate isomerase [Methanosarcinales archaeon]
MSEVLYDQEWLKGQENLELYYMYRDLYLSRADRDRLLEHDLRYDITVIPPRTLGSEYVKTAGHYHPLVPGQSVSYPEIYEVLEGEALYLLQNEDASDVVAVKATAGDKVLIPPGYGHITINPSNKRLKMANFIARSFSSNYGPIKERKGAAYYCTTQGYVRNREYPSPGDLRQASPLAREKLRELGMSRSREMYSLVREPHRLEMLTSPQKHAGLFADALV